MCIEFVIDNDYDERKNEVKIIESILKKNKKKINWNKFYILLGITFFQEIQQTF